MPHQLLRKPLTWVVVGLLVVAAASQLVGREPSREPLTYAEFVAAVERGDVRDAAVDDATSSIEGRLDDGTRYRTTYLTEAGADVTELLLDNDVAFEVERSSTPLWLSLLFELLPFALIGGVFFLVMRSVAGGSQSTRFGRAKARPLSADQPRVTFADVAGLPEAVEELGEIRDFLASPARFQAIGARIPRGVLLYGPPGTGKTLLARAVAGEAGVPFFSISGSDFVEMFVGVGASRVRDLFEQAKKAAPAIIFVDEIDAVGRHRGSGTGGGHDEREQTLNQLLVEMDGFDQRAGVMLIAASNRPDILDPALLRPGRFDRQIVVDRPDLVGRRAILDVHCQGKPLGDDVDLEILARRTPGFTGADLSNLVNEAALLTARRSATRIGMGEMEDAIDRVIAGPERKSRVLSEDEKRVIAYHEGGHALVGHVLPHADPIHKVSVVARGRALGWTLALPTEDRHLQTRSQLLDELVMLLGGRTAEELVFGDPTTGAQDDIDRATTVARAMVVELGMSDALGLQRVGPSPTGTGSRGDGGETATSDHVATLVDTEVRRLLDEAHREAAAILATHRSTLDELAAALIERETLDTPELLAIFGSLDVWNRAAPVAAP